MSKPTSWKPGQSGNPNGRPPKSRALTAILETALNKTIPGSPQAESKVSRKRLLAEHIAEFVTTGRVTLPDNRVLEAESVTDWLTAVKWLYQHVDGPPRTELDVTSGGEQLQGITYITENRPNADD